MNHDIIDHDIHDAEFNRVRIVTSAPHGTLMVISTGADIVVNADGLPGRVNRVELAGSMPGSLTVTGNRTCDAVRSGAGAGEAERKGPGDAIRTGTGTGNAIKRGQERGDAIRDGAGMGNAICHGVGDAIKSGTGIGHSFHMTGLGDSKNDSEGDGEAHCYGHGEGNSYREGTGNGNSVCTSYGNAFYSSSGIGNCYHLGIDFNEVLEEAANSAD